MVQDYFQSRGYEDAVCSCFLRHKITGAILLELDLAYLKEIDIASFGTRFEISKEIKHLNQMTEASFAQSVNSAPNSHANNTHNPQSPNSAPPQNALMSPPTFKRQSVLRSVKDNAHLNSFLATTTASPPYLNQPSPQTPGNRMSNPHRKDSSFDPNWVHPATIKKQQEQEQPQNQDDYSDEVSTNLRTPRAQMGGRFRSSTISTTDQYLYDNNSASPDIMPTPTYQSLQVAKPNHGKSFSGNSSAYSHSRKSSYVEDTRLRHNTHSRQGSYETVRGSDLPEGAIYSAHKHSRSTSSIGLSDFKFLKPYTNGTLPDTFAEDDGEKLATKGKRRSSIIATLVKPLPLRRKDSSDIPESPRSKKEIEADGDPKSRRISTDPTMNRTPTSNSTEGPGPKPTPADGNKKKTMLRSSSSQNNLRSKTFASSKQKTSAFQEGINAVSPADAAKTADFSGWMSKRGSVAVGTWKTRYFCLHGTRLSYFTSLSDSRERGLIDINSHRVVPVGESDDKFVALYAASVGAGRHCFKVVPPSPGSRKGVTFTMPKVHYFAVDTREEMRAWMKALMKATIDRDDSVPIISSCVTPTIPLIRAQELLAEARAKEENRGQPVVAAAVQTNGGAEGFVPERQVNGTWLTGFGYGNNSSGGDPSTPDSPSNSSSLRSSGTGSSDTAASVNRSTKSGQPTDYFNEVPASAGLGGQ